MQAILNAAREYGFFVDRGDPVAFDWDTNDFTKDSTWRELDLSGIVPEHAHGVLFAVVVKSTAVDKSFGLRSKGNANSINASFIRTVVANLRHSADLACPCNADRKIDYLAGGAVWPILNLAVKGWWY